MEAGERPDRAAAEAAVRACFTRQAAWCQELGSPLTALLVGEIGNRLDRSTRIGRRILDWPQQGLAASALPLRVAAGLHALVRRGRLPPLAALYPPHPPTAETAGLLWPAVAAAFEQAGDALSPWLDLPPQTNEVARSAILMAGLTEIAARTRHPLALHELGASAGLNLIPDRYAYDLGGSRVGQVGSLLRLSPRWQGPALPAARVIVATRRGVDLNPLDVTDASDRERLLAYVWADQAGRLARMEAAIGIARQNPPKLDRAEAADWTEQRFAGRSGMTSVLMHSVAMQYFEAASRERIARHLHGVGARASAAAPVAWLRFEIAGDQAARPTLTLTLWPGGAEQVLATGSAHGHWIDWQQPGRTTAPPPLNRGPGW